MESKICTKCGVEKPVSEYHKAKLGKYGVKAICKPCNLTDFKKYREDNPDKRRVTQRNYQEKYKDEIKEKRDAKAEENCERARLWYQSNRERARATASNWVKNNRARHRENCLRWQKAHPSVGTAKALRYRLRYPERSLESGRKWRQNNKDRVNARKAARIAAKLRATPAWANHAKIREAYRQAKELTQRTGIAHHVDHIVPLRSKIVCGLHWEENLQVLPWKDNQLKGNRHWPDMP
jgi:hypothetical protein